MSGSRTCRAGCRRRVACRSWLTIRSRRVANGRSSRRLGSSPRLPSSEWRAADRLPRTRRREARRLRAVADRAQDDGRAASTSTNKRIRQLERELARKEKALAEAAALLVLKKKWRTCTIRTRTTTPTSRTRSDSGGDRRGAGIRRALDAGVPRARHLALAPSSAGAEIRMPAIAAAGRIVGRSNALTPAEEAQVVTVHDELALRWPVAEAAGAAARRRGLYLASESTMYRLQRRHGLRTKTAHDQRERT